MPDRAATGPNVKVVNLTRNRMVVEDGRVADGLLGRLRGLIGHRPLETGQGLLIVPCQSIHMFFMAFPIDVLYVTPDLEVAGIDHTINPWQVGRPQPRARFVLELPAGTAKATGTQVGDRLRIDGYTVKAGWLRPRSR